MNARVSIVRCYTYNPEEVYSSIRRAFDLLGGVSSFISTGERVIVKPNILSGRRPEDGVNTHVEVVRAILKLVKECGAWPKIADNPGGTLSPKDAYLSSGILSLAKEEDVECLEVKGVKVVRGIPIASYFFECEKIISVPKMKTHSLMGLTGAVKNMFGAVSGLNKSHLHKKFPVPEEFAGILVDVFSVVRPHLVLMDGVVAMHGDGPSSGFLKPTALLIAGQDSVAVDAVFSELVGIDPLKILTTKEAFRRGLGVARIDKIEILGEELERCRIKDFKMPRFDILRKFPEPFIKLLAGFVKFAPYIDEGMCMRCRMCVETCPVDAITTAKSHWFIDRKRCILCMCCHEVCPSLAVKLKRNILARMLGL